MDRGRKKKCAVEGNEGGKKRSVKILKKVGSNGRKSILIVLELQKYGFLFSQVNHGLAL